MADESTPVPDSDEQPGIDGDTTTEATPSGPVTDPGPAGDEDQGDAEELDHVSMLQSIGVPDMLLAADIEGAMSAGEPGLYGGRAMIALGLLTTPAGLHLSGLHVHKPIGMLLNWSQAGALAAILQHIGSNAAGADRQEFEAGYDHNVKQLADVTFTPCGWTWMVEGQFYSCEQVTGHYVNQCVQTLASGAQVYGPPAARCSRCTWPLIDPGAHECDPGQIATYAMYRGARQVGEQLRNLAKRQGEPLLTMLAAVNGR